MIQVNTIPDLVHIPGSRLMISFVACYSRVSAIFRQRELSNFIEWPNKALVFYFTGI